MMIIRDDTINELLAKTTTKGMGRPTHAWMEKMRKELSKIGSSIKTMYKAFPEGYCFGYAAATITAMEYHKRVTVLGCYWKFKKLTNLAIYDTRIKILTAEFTKSQQEA